LQASISEPLGLGRTLSSKPDTCAGAGGTANIDVTGGTPPYTYTWSNGGGNTDSLSNLNTGTYIVTITDFDGCSVSDTFSIGYLQGLAINFTEVKNVSCYDDRNGAITATLIGNGALPYIYQWSNLANTASINRLDTGIYTLTVSDANGCTVEDSAVIAKEVCTSYVFFPTGFTPNGDGINDRFKPKYSEDLSQYTIRVYNRWGELVYQSNDINEGWNGYYKGMLQPLGVYVFVSEYSFNNSKLIGASGNITLLK
jgi:gliding motility-associated-like protein